MVRLAWVVCLVAMASPALALEDPDTEVARRHFEIGRGYYDAKDYRKALDEFLTARNAKGAPALDYNIARCYDRLEDYQNAVKHYQLYLDGKPNAPDNSEIRDRIVVLKKRLDDLQKANQKGVEPPPRPPVSDGPILLPSGLERGPLVDNHADVERARRRRNGAIAGGVVAGAVVIAGAIVLGILLSQPSGGSLTKSDLGPFTVTK